MTGYGLTFAKLGRAGTGGMKVRDGVKLQFLLNLGPSSKKHVPSGPDMTIKFSFAVAGVG